MGYQNSSRLFLVIVLIVTSFLAPSFYGIRDVNALSSWIPASENAHSGNAGREHQDNGSSISSYILLFKGKPTDEDVVVVQSHHGKINRIYNIIDGMAISLPEKMVDALARDNPRIASIEPDIEVHSTDINLDKQIRADQVWTSSSYPSTGRGTSIAVLDTGIDVTHPEFTGRIALCRSEILNSDGTCSDQNGHGTHTAGIASASGVNSLAEGVAPGSILYIDQVLDSTGSGSMSGIIAGIDWSVAKGAKIVSMSLSTSWTTSVSPDCDSTFPSLAAAIDNAVAAGVTVVAAAGNSGSAGVGAPGCISSSIAVGAVDSTDNIALFSGRGSAMADHGIVAPGVGIYSSYKGGTYATASGTSMATPAVAGVAALMLGADQTLTPAQIKESIFQNSCRQTTSPSCPAITVTPGSSYGFGRVDSYASTLVVPPASSSDFSVSASTGSITIAKGKSSSLSVSLGSLDGFASSNIELSAKSSPSTSAISYSFSPTSVLVPQGGTGTSKLTINVAKNATPGVYIINITATDKDGSSNNGIKITHSIQITLDVTKR